MPTTARLQPDASAHFVRIGCRAAARQFLDRANEVGWQAIIRQSPETGARLRQLIAN